MSTNELFDEPFAEMRRGNTPGAVGLLGRDVADLLAAHPQKFARVELPNRTDHHTFRHAANRRLAAIRPGHIVTVCCAAGTTYQVSLVKKMSAEAKEATA